MSFSLCPEGRRETTNGDLSFFACRIPTTDTSQSLTLPTDFGPKRASRLMHKAADEVDRKSRRRRWRASYLQRRDVARAEWEHTNCIFQGGRSVGSEAPRSRSGSVPQNAITLASRLDRIISRGWIRHRSESLTKLQQGANNQPLECGVLDFPREKKKGDVTSPVACSGVD